MSRQLKRWESPRREGRNHKGRGGSARQRQKRKQLQALRQQLQTKEPSKDQSGKDSSPSHFVVGAHPGLHLGQKLQILTA